MENLHIALLHLRIDISQCLVMRQRSCPTVITFCGLLGNVGKREIFHSCYIYIYILKNSCISVFNILHFGDSVFTSFQKNTIWDAPIMGWTCDFSYGSTEVCFLFVWSHALHQSNYLEHLKTQMHVYCVMCVFSSKVQCPPSAVYPVLRPDHRAPDEFIHSR